MSYCVGSSYVSIISLFPQGPEFDEEEESELTVTELRERAQKQKAELERRMMGDGSDDDDKDNTDADDNEGDGEGEGNKSHSKVSEDSGCSWGMGELPLLQQCRRPERATLSLLLILYFVVCSR